MKNVVKLYHLAAKQQTRRRKFSFANFAKLFLLTLLTAHSAFAAGGAGPASKFELAVIKGTIHSAATPATSSSTTAPAIVAGAKISLVKKSDSAAKLAAVSGATGEFSFENLQPGDYLLTIEAAGLTTVSKEISLEPGATLNLEIELTAAFNETVTVRADGGGDSGLLSVTETTPPNVVSAQTLKEQPLRSDNFQSAVQLTPGAVRDGNGNIYLKGTRSGQSAYTVNGADVTDPVTGNLAFDLPLEAAQSIQVEDNPYSAEVGRFTGGVTNLQTKGGADKFKISAARFIPTFHNIFSSTIDSFRPRLTLSGPIFSKKLYFLQSFEYRFSRIFVPSQQKPNDNIVQEGFNSFTQIDWNINKNNVLKFNAAIFPNKYRNFGLDTFNSAAVTPNYQQHGTLFSVAEQSVFKAGAFLSSEISYKTFSLDLSPKSNSSFILTPQGSKGAYFAASNRRTERWQWQEAYSAAPFKFLGDHSLKTGFDLNLTKIDGQVRYNSIFIRRTDNTLAQRIDFRSAAPFAYNYRETALFVQDKWVLNPKLTLDYGFRADLDGVTKNHNFAPRFSFLFVPAADGRTVIRGGIGVFYDRSLANAGYFNDAVDDSDSTDTSSPLIPVFDRMPRRIVRNYAADGLTVTGGGARFFTNRVVGSLLTPRSIRYSLQIDRSLAKNLSMRIGFLERYVANDLLIDPVKGSGRSDTLTLSSRGRSRYDELQFVFNYNHQTLGQWNASYVLSKARGDLNTADAFLGDMPVPVIRPNEYGRLSFDTPQRFLLTGQVSVSKKHEINFSPIFELHSGFPFSAVNERLEFVGARNAAGRLPAYLSLDLQMTKGIKLPFIDKRARIGVIVLNSTNHFNPRDVQTNLTSPNYGKFYNSLGRSFKAKFDIDF